jgi:hypothetical protein
MRPSLPVLELLFLRPRTIWVDLPGGLYRATDLQRHASVRDDGHGMDFNSGSGGGSLVALVWKLWTWIVGATVYTVSCQRGHEESGIHRLLALQCRILFWCRELLPAALQGRKKIFG